MKVENRINPMQQAEYYNQLIWTVFSVGIALALYILREIWPYKTNFGVMQIFEAFFGYLVLFYCTLAIESFVQKKRLIQLLNNTKNLKIKTYIDSLPFTRMDWIAEIILGFIFSSYILVFLFGLSHRIFAQNFYWEMIGIDLFFLVICILILGFVITNWLKRPIEIKNKNYFERHRICLAKKFGIQLKYYEKLISQ